MARLKKNKPVKKNLLLVVEGATEKIYFERLKELERYATLRIKPDLPKHRNMRKKNRKVVFMIMYGLFLTEMFYLHKSFLKQRWN